MLHFASMQLRIDRHSTKTGGPACEETLEHLAAILHGEHDAIAASEPMLRNDPAIRAVRWLNSKNVRVLPRSVTAGLSPKRRDTSSSSDARFMRFLPLSKAFELRRYAILLSERRATPLRGCPIHRDNRASRAPTGEHWPNASMVDAAKQLGVLGTLYQYFRNACTPLRSRETGPNTADELFKRSRSFHYRIHYSAPTRVLG